MVKHTQTIRQLLQQPTFFLSMFDHFVGLERKGLKSAKQLSLLKIFIYNARPKFSLLKTFSSTKQNYTQFWRVVIQPFRYDSR